MASRPRSFGRWAALLGVALVLVWWTSRQADAPMPGPVAGGPSTPATSASLRDLERDEERGGHTLARHVGRTDDELRERLERERGISAASTYTDRAVAARVVTSTIEGQADRIGQWIARGERRPNLALDYRGPRDEIIGRSLERGRAAPVPVTDAVVVLRADGDDYFVLTSYPERRR